MKNRYEGLLVLDTQGKEDTVKDVIDRLEKDFKRKARKSSRSRKWRSATFPIRPAR